MSTPKHYLTPACSTTRCRQFWAASAAFGDAAAAGRAPAQPPFFSAVLQCGVEEDAVAAGDSPPESSNHRCRQHLGFCVCVAWHSLLLCIARCMRCSTSSATGTVCVCLRCTELRLPHATQAVSHLHWQGHGLVITAAALSSYL